MRNIFLKAVFIAIAGFILAHICYQYSGEFLNEYSLRQSWISSIKFTNTDTSQKTVYPGIISIIINNENGNIKIHQNDKSNRDVEFWSKLDKDSLLVTEQNHILTIKSKDPASGMSMILSVPSSVKNIEITSKSGLIKLNNLTLDRLTINTQSGDLSLNSVSIDQALIQSLNSDINWSGVSKNLKLKTISGNFTLDSSYHNPQYDIDTDSGDVTLNISSPIDATLDMKSVSGHVVANHTGTVSQNSQGVIKVRSVSGNIQITGK